jgi:Protein of unknown function (DUF3037)
MASQYSVIQYVPDTVADERINFGVIAFDEHAIATRFLKHWSRVSCFGRGDLRFLRDFARSMESKVGRRKEDVPKLTVAEVLEMSQGWMDAIQVTEPRASLKDVHELIEEVARLYLVEPERRVTGFRDREDAAALTRAKVRQAVQRRVADPIKTEKLVKAGQIEGAFYPHQLDVLVGNGAPYFGAHGISLEIPRAHLLKRALDSTLWTIDDVKRGNPDLPVGVLLLVPPIDAPHFERAAEQRERTERALTALEANVLDEQTVEGWADQQAKQFSAELVHA